ncbi:MAG TPA: hypothetical protein VN698_09810 [Bacteroidia bacterium]|nr:hypothetical protein [Bacteroidia bacterium]
MNIPNPEQLPREQYYKAYADFLYLQKVDRELLFETFKQALTEAFHGKQD